MTVDSHVALSKAGTLDERKAYDQRPVKQCRKTVGKTNEEFWEHISWYRKLPSVYRTLNQDCPYFVTVRVALTLTARRTRKRNVLCLGLRKGLCVISGFRREVDENCVLLGCCAASSGNYLPKFRDNLSGFFKLKPWRSDPIGCTGTSVRNYQYSLRNNRDERSSEQVALFTAGGNTRSLSGTWLLACSGPQREGYQSRHFDTCLMGAELNIVYVI
jgi:hypothetical protein